MKNFLVMNIIKKLMLLNILLLLGSIFVPPIAAAAGSVEFSWLPNAESNVSGYKIYYGTASGGSYSNFIDINSNVPDQDDGRIHGTVTGLSYDILYYFVCRAYDDLGAESDISNEVAYMPKAPPAPAIISIQIQ